MVWRIAIAVIASSKAEAALKLTEKSADKFALDAVDQSKKLPDEETYEAKLRKRQTELLAIQQAYLRQKLRGIVVLEGWDCAGKGGLVRRLGAKLDPRTLQVWPIAAPTAEEQGRHYLYRFWQKLPQPGSIAVFDRSWYGRVLVERVEGLVDESAWKRAYDEINAFEEALVADGVRLVKIFLHITPEEQLARFRERLAEPYKRWKLTEEDLRNRARWDDYVVAIEEMFARTSTEAAPWHVIAANFKWYARVKALKTMRDVLGDAVDVEPPPVDPKIEAALKAA